jgi:hypothetical protein
MPTVPFGVVQDVSPTHNLQAVQVGVDGGGRPILSQEVYLGRLVPVAATLSQRKLSVGASAVSLNPPAGAEFAYVEAISIDLAFWDTGTVPTPTDGFPMAAGQVWQVFIPDLTQFRMISSTGAAVTVWVAYYKRG